MLRAEGQWLVLWCRRRALVQWRRAVSCGGWEGDA